MKKNVIALILAAAMLTLTSCAGGPEKSSSPAAPASSATSSETSVGEQAAAKPQASGKTLVVGTMANSLGLPVHMAETKGYFKDAGLDVDIEIFATGAPINEAMASGDLDVAVSGMASVYALSTGMYQYIGDGVITTGGESIFARADSAIAKAGANDKGIIGTADTVKGASILGPLATTAHYQAINYVETFGLTASDFNMVSMDYAQAYQAFITGEGDLIAAKMPYTNQLEEAGYVRVCDMNQVLDNPIVDTIFVQDKVAEERAGDLELFLDCYYRACADLMNDEASRRQVASNWYAEEGINYSESDMNTEIAVKEYYTLDTVDTNSNPGANGSLGAFMVNIGQFFVTQGMISDADFPNIAESINRTFLNSVKQWSGK